MVFSRWFLCFFGAAVCAVPAFAGAAVGRLVLHPDRLELRGSTGEHGVLVTLVDASGRVSDVTQKSRFTSSTPGIVSVTPKGLCQPVGDGAGEVEVGFEGHVARVPVTVAEVGTRASPSFKQDILPILTKAGCNAGGCHGKLAGQNGFRLSLRAFAPEWDHDWLTKEVNARRINVAFPEQSLLVQKPVGEVVHEGGTKFRKDSRYYRTLVDWIAARAPGPVADEKDAARLEVLPGHRELQPGDKQQLLVRAHYADGRVRDVTWLAQFFSNDESTVSVKPNGLVKALRAGESSVRVHFQGQVEVVRLTMPFTTQVAATEFEARSNAVDGAVFKKLRDLRIPPSPPCDDATFLRRASLDATGTLPTAEETAAFLADERPDKRTRLVDELLARPEWIDHWTLQLADLLQNRKERDHDVRGIKGVRSFHAWLRAQLVANRSWKDIASAVLLTKGDTLQNPEIGYYVTVVGEKQSVEESELPDSVAQSFLGTRIGCARCHNHPLEKYTQDDFYHFAAFFSKVSLRRSRPEFDKTLLTTVSREEDEQRKRLPGIEEKLADAESLAAAIGEEGGGEEARKAVAERQKEREEILKRIGDLAAKAPGVTQPRTGKFMPPQPLDGTTFVPVPGKDPREQFVAWMLQTENFSGAMVNRIWKHFLGVGLVEPVDDLRASNPPSNPELWKLLNHEFATSGFDLRHVMRLVLNSRVYQLSAETVAGNETDAKFYSHYYARRLPAEVLLDAISAATQVPTKFDGYPLGMRAVQLPEPSVGSYFLTLFGRSDRVTACACERRGEVTLPQLLHLQNSDDLQKQIGAPEGRLAALLKNPSDSEVLEAMFLATVNRKPTPGEVAAVTAALSPEQREPVFKDLFWALLNSKEFAFNH